MSNPTDQRMMCLDAAIRTPNITQYEVTKQAKEYYEFVSGAAKRKEHKIVTAMKSAVTISKKRNRK